MKIMKKKVTAFALMLIATFCVYSSQSVVVEYYLTPDVPVTIRTTANDLLFSIGDMEPVPMEMTGKDMWRDPGTGIDVRFIREKVGGLVKALEMTRFMETVHLEASVDPEALFEDAPQRMPEVLDELVPRLMIANNVPGVSMAGIDDGKVVWTREWGVKEAGSEERVTDATMFEAASMSKAPFAYVVLRMVDRGEFDLDRPLVDIYGTPYEKVVKDTPDDTLHKMITARMVFQHQTGFPNWSRDNPLLPAFEPGTDVRYSGEGFEFCQRVVEDITGLPLNRLMRKELFDPLDMELSNYIWEDHYPEISSSGHDSDGKVMEDRRIIEEPGNAAYTLYTTPYEYALFLIDVMGMTPSDGSLLTDESRQEMLNPTVHDPGRGSLPRAGEPVSEDVYWGLSWRALETTTGTRFHHGGSNSTGFRCLSEFNPEAGDGIIIMTNAVGGSSLRNEVFRMISLP